MSLKTVIVTGASGLLGRAVYKYFINESLRNQYPLNFDCEYKWNCIGLCNKRIKDNLKPLDLTDFSLVENFIEKSKPDVIIHCAAEKQFDNCENNYEDSLKINCDSTSFLANLCAKQNIIFVYISTDYVFDGTNPPYKVDAQTNPLSKYGKTKLKGEEVTRNSSENHCIVRVPVLYGHTEPLNYKESAINVIYEIVKKLDPTKQDNIQTRFPTHCLDVARFCMTLIINRFQGNSQVKGILHCSALEAYTKYEMACLIADLFAIDKSHIKPDETVSAQSMLRPKNSQLDTEYTFKLINFYPLLKFRDSIKDCLENFA